jgi:adiponectin receptor
MRLKLDDVRTRFHELDFQKLHGYIPQLANHLKNLHNHLSSVELSSGLPVASSTHADLLDALLSSDIVTDILNSTPGAVEADAFLERTACEVTNAVKLSFDGLRLISYSDLPIPWRCNAFVRHGYRFIPIERWPLIVLSLFACHNETLNIYTHLIPFLHWAIGLTPLYNSSPTYDLPELLFMSFALLCLLCSTIWHTMAGCAHHDSVEFCAKVDYVGIGWLISASIGTVVYYGYKCHPEIGYYFLALSFGTGLAGSIFPFMSWFNQVEHRFSRVCFFLILAFSGIVPLFTLALLHSGQEVLYFIAPVTPSFLSYIIGLIFYVTQFPECILLEKFRRRLDTIGIGSHAIWHCFIVLAVSQHKSAIGSMKEGLQCLIST